MIKIELKGSLKTLHYIDLYYHINVCTYMDKCAIQSKILDIECIIEEIRDQLDGDTTTTEVKQYFDHQWTCDTRIIKRLDGVIEVLCEVYQRDFHGGTTLPYMFKKGYYLSHIKHVDNTCNRWNRTLYFTPI